MYIQQNVACRQYCTHRGLSQTVRRGTNWKRVAWRLAGLQVFGGNAILTKTTTTTNLTILPRRGRRKGLVRQPG